MANKCYVMLCYVMLCYVMLPILSSPVWNYADRVKMLIPKPNLSARLRWALVCVETCLNTLVHQRLAPSRHEIWDVTQIQRKPAS